MSELDHEVALALTDFYKAVTDALNALMAKVDARARAEANATPDSASVAQGDAE